MRNRQLAIAVLMFFPALALPAGAQSVKIVDTIPGEFTDISGTGSDLGLGDEDEVEITTTIGNPVFPAGVVTVARNGGVGFGPLPSADLGPLNQPIPSGDAFGGGRSALPFWDDIGNDVGTVLWQESMDVVIIQWEKVPFEGSEATARFEVKIFGNARVPTYAQFIYADIEGLPRPGGGVSATIGYQDGGAGFGDFQWSFDTAGAVSNGKVLTVIPEPATAVLLLSALVALRRR